MAEQQQVKLFVGGVSDAITEELLREYFCKYGTVVETYIRRDSGRTSRGGFGFVTFADADSLTRVLQDQQEHFIQGQRVEVKRAMNRGHKNLDSNGNNHFPSKKIFVGGLSSSLTEEEFKNYFERFGRITDVVVMHDSATRRPRGFGFITFESEESVEHVLQNNFYELNGKQVEVKKAVPKEANNSNKNGHNMRMGGGRGSPFPQYGHNLHYAPAPAPAPAYEMVHPYYAYPVYGCVDNYGYATSMYPGGYFMGESGGVDYGSAPFRHPWNGPGTLGSPIVYPPYSSGRVGLLDRVTGSANGLAGRGTISRSLVDVIPTPYHIDSSLKDTTAHVHAPSLALTNSDGVKLDSVCDGEVCDSAEENSACGSLKEDGVASLHSKDDGCESSSHLKANCVASTSDLKRDGTLDFFDGDAPPGTKDDGAASSPDSHDDDATYSMHTKTDSLKCNGAASYSSSSILNLKELEEQLTPSPDCDSS